MIHHQHYFLCMNTPQKPKIESVENKRKIMQDIDKMIGLAQKLFRSRKNISLWSINYTCDMLIVYSTVDQKSFVGFYISYFLPFNYCNCTQTKKTEFALQRKLEDAIITRLQLGSWG